MSGPHSRTCDECLNIGTLVWYGTLPQILCQGCWEKFNEEVQSFRVLAVLHFEPAPEIEAIDYEAAQERAGPA